MIESIGFTGLAHPRHGKNSREFLLRFHSQSENGDDCAVWRSHRSGDEHGRALGTLTEGCFARNRTRDCHLPAKGSHQERVVTSWRVASEHVSVRRSQDPAVWAHNDVVQVLLGFEEGLEMELK